MYGISLFCSCSENRDFLHIKISHFCIFFAEIGRFKYKQNSRSSRRSSGRCLSERVDIFLSSGEPSGWSKHDVCDRRPATWMSPRAVPVRMRYTLSTALENSHSETDICLRAFCRFGSSSGLRLPPLRTMPIHKIVSKERCQSYFIDGCRRIKIERNNLLCEQAPTEVFRSIFAWLVARLTFQLVLKAMNRCGDTATAVDESITGEGIHGHDGCVT